MDRGYYMAELRYEIISKYFFLHEKKNVVSPSEDVIFFLLYKIQWYTDCKEIDKNAS